MSDQMATNRIERTPLAIVDALAQAADRLRLVQHRSQYPSVPVIIEQRA